MKKISLRKLFEKEREVFESYKETNPELFISPEIPEKELLSHIGVNIPFKQRLEGYIRLYFYDFIVEELSLDKELSEIEPKEDKKILAPPLSRFSLYTNLIKVGISTSDAIFSLSEKLNIGSEKIGYAGLKDVKALTSQRIVFPNIDLETFKRIKGLSFPNFFLTNFSFGKGSIQPGQMYGNRFTIFIRTRGKANKNIVLQNLKRIEKEGFLNFYHFQRFGTPRLLSHILGKLIFQGKYEEAVFSFLFDKGVKGIPLITELRKEAESSRNWREVERIFKEFPYTFRNELRLVSYLKKHPGDFTGALIFIKDQTALWIYAYTSYLANLLLSLDEKMGLPKKIPLLLSNDLKDREVYRFWIEKDKIENFPENIKPFRFIVFKKRFIKSRVFPQKIQYKILPEGIILSFILEKGSYATTFLMNLFEIKTGLPLPEWVDLKKYDIKKELGIGSVEEVKKILGEEIFKLPK